MRSIVFWISGILPIKLVQTAQLTVPPLPGHQPTAVQSGFETSPDHGLAAWTGSHPLGEVRRGLDVMQTEWFELWVGAWPTAIDWTSAVINTLMIASLNTLSRALDVGSEKDEHLADSTEIENELNLYFAQSAAYYFGENAFAIRNQAYDDMLWVVLGWLENTNFIQTHCARHSNNSAKVWHGSQYVDAYAHRARVFYELASRGWDTTLCGGGMTWNPSLTPYKNAITNELFISASIGMYLYFTGDSNSSPFMVAGVEYAGFEPAEPHNSDHLRAAVEAYEWLRSSNMTNEQGLYVDGFHIRGWSRSSNGTGNCDERNEMVYTYNQGVILSGLRGLWESTGDVTYLRDGWTLLERTISATGWELEHGAASNSSAWAGLGRHGVLHDICDSSGHCDQDAQIFKGIFFHHLTLFCEPLPSTPTVPGVTFAAPRELAHEQMRKCQGYSRWVVHNARAALATRDEGGRFGGWWGADDEFAHQIALPNGAVEYRRTESIPYQHSWRHSDSPQRVAPKHGSGSCSSPETLMPEYDDTRLTQQDLNDRGRGRTVETQASGIAVVRAMWQLLNMAA